MELVPVQVRLNQTDPVGCVLQDRKHDSGWYYLEISSYFFYKQIFPPRRILGTSRRNKMYEV